ncbi:MAG: DNA polymerase I [Candidatus Melainabacteria bacterium]|jgi:DNA polymerase I|nr:DNA polymerase I [Candidatus Melainabacteria bacterium]
MVTKTKQRLLLIDGSNLAFRMFFALEMSNLRDVNGNPTWAVYGTLKALFDTIEFAKPCHAAVAFDLPEPTYRHKIFEDYKANRPDAMPDDLLPQWEVIKEGFRRFHIPVLEEAGYEADDLIGIMAKKAERDGYEVVILSGDKDLFQLVTENVSMAVPKRGGGLEVFGPDEVFEKMGVRPDQIIDYKGIAGDSSDNIPGVRGLGPKAATKLLGEYGDLDGVYKNIEAIGPPKTKEKLIEQEEQARMSKHIATIIIEEDGIKNCDLGLSHCKLDMPDTDNLISFLKELDFNSILKRLPMVLKPFNDGNLAKVDVGDLPASPEPQTVSRSKGNDMDYKPKNQERWADIDKEIKELDIKAFVVLDEAVLNNVIKEIQEASVFAVDLETTGLNTLSCDIVGWALAYKKADKIKNYYIPVRHQEIKQLDPDLVRDKLKAILEDETKLQIIQNAKYEQKIFRRIGIKIHNNFFDTMLASYVFNPANKHGLKMQSKRVFGLRMVEIEDLIGTGRKQITIDNAPLDKVANYAAADAYITFKLYEHYHSIFDEREQKLLKSLEFPLVDVLAEIELAGVKLDTGFLAELSLDIHKKIDKLIEEIHGLAGQEFNISSPKQLSDILYGPMSMPTVGKKTKSGGYSTDMGTLETILNDYELDKQQEAMINSVIEYRTLTKLASTYIDNLPNLVDKTTGRLHSDFNQVVTATGRLSSSNPNLQNIPIKSEYGRQIRKAFVPIDDEHLIISADYSQIELRVLAHMADEKALIDAFNNDQDIHQRTAMEIFGLKAEEVDSDKRRIGKTLNFALIYMQGPFATAKQLGITMSAARKFTAQYFDAFPNIKPFMDARLDAAHEDEYTETLLGRRRYFRNINSPNKMLSKEEERQAFNAALQGTAADIIKVAMISLNNKLKDKKSRIILQVHDELVLEVHKSEEAEVKELMVAEMSNAYKLKVPLKVDIGAGDNWLDAK